MAIKVFGAGWCSMTQATREQLDSLGIAYQYTDIDQDREAAAWVREQNHGKESKPTLDVGGTILSEPTDHELEAVLRDQGLLARRASR